MPELICSAPFCENIRSHKCNMGLGYFNDNPELTQAASNYLVKTRHLVLHDTKHEQQMYYRPW